MDKLDAGDGVVGGLLLTVLWAFRHWWRKWLNQRPAQQPSITPPGNGSNGGIVDAATRGFSVQIGGWEKLFNEANTRGLNCEERERKLMEVIANMREEIGSLRAQVADLRAEVAEWRDNATGN